MLPGGQAQEAAPPEDPMDKKTDIGSYYQKPARALSIAALDQEKRKFFLIGVAIANALAR